MLFSLLGSTGLRGKIVFNLNPRQGKIAAPAPPASRHAAPLWLTA